MNPYDGTAATVIPQNVEKIPLFHWRPGARLLAVGSRDGADFSGDIHADRSTYRRALSAAVLREAQAKQRLDGVLACWSASLDYPLGMSVLSTARSGALVIATPGIGDPELLEHLLPLVDAWLLLCPVMPGPLAQRILAAGQHVEVLVGLVDEHVPELDWEHAAAVHLCAVRSAEAERLDQWCLAARTTLPAAVAIYDHHHPHTDCTGCGERIVWRHGGRSRIDGLDTSGKCLSCATPSPLRLN